MGETFLESSVRDDGHVAIDTPERLILRLPLAGLGSRFVAQIIDDVIRTVGLMALFILTMIVVPNSFWRWLFEFSTLGSIIAGLAVVILVLGTFIGYDAFFEGYRNGQTPGKKTMRIRVVMDDGRPIHARAALTRALMSLVDQLPNMYLLGGIVALLRDDRKRLGDLVAGTTVIRLDQPTAQKPIADNVPPKLLNFTRDQLRSLGLREYEMLAELRSRPQNRALRHKIASNLAKRLDLDIPPIADAKNWLLDLERQLKIDLQRR